MPYKHPTAAAVSNRERQRRCRERRREERRLAALLPPETPPDVLPSDAADLPGGVVLRAAVCATWTPP